MTTSKRARRHASSSSSRRRSRSPGRPPRLIARFTIRWPSSRSAMRAAGDPMSSSSGCGATWTTVRRSPPMGGSAGGKAEMGAIVPYRAPGQAIAPRDRGRCADEWGGPQTLDIVIVVLALSALPWSSPPPGNPHPGSTGRTAARRLERQPCRAEDWRCLRLRRRGSPSTTTSRARASRCCSSRTPAPTTPATPSSCRPTPSTSGASRSTCRARARARSPPGPTRPSPRPTSSPPSSTPSRWSGRTWPASRSAPRSACSWPRGTPARVRSLSLHSAWATTDPFLRALLESWMALARGVPAVADAVILGIFPWCFTPEMYVERPDFIAGLEDFVRGRPGPAAGGVPRPVPGGHRPRRRRRARRHRRPDPDHLRRA